MWYVVPTFWVNYEKMTIFYPPSGTCNVDQFYIQERRVPEERWQSDLQISTIQATIGIFIYLQSTYHLLKYEKYGFHILILGNTFFMKYSLGFLYS